MEYVCPCRHGPLPIKMMQSRFSLADLLHFLHTKATIGTASFQKVPSIPNEMQQSEEGGPRPQFPLEVDRPGGRPSVHIYSIKKLTTTKTTETVRSRERRRRSRPRVLQKLPRPEKKFFGAVGRGPF